MSSVQAGVTAFFQLEPGRGDILESVFGLRQTGLPRRLAVSFGGSALHQRSTCPKWDAKMLRV